MENSRNLWPIGIMLILSAVVGLIIWTINLASGAKVYIDNSYMNSDYNSVDESFNNIQILQSRFNEKYRFEQVSSALIAGDNIVAIKVIDKERGSIDGANVDFLITRPHTSAQDIKLSTSNIKDGIYESEPFRIESPGRWQVVYRATIGDATGFYRQELNVTRK